MLSMMYGLFSIHKEGRIKTETWNPNHLREQMPHTKTKLTNIRSSVSKFIVNRAATTNPQITLLNYQLIGDSIGPEGLTKIRFITV